MPRQHVALAHRVHLGSTGGDDDLVRVHVEHVLRCADHHERSGVDADDVVAVARVEHEHLASVGAESGRLGRARLAGTDDRDVDVAAMHLDAGVDRRLDGVLRGIELQRRSADGRVPTYPQPRTCRGEAGAGERHAVDVGRAVAAVTGETQGASVLRVLPRPRHRHGHRIAVDEVDRLIIECEAHSASNSNPASE